MEQKIKPGDIVRLTDPLSNGEIVRIESVNEHGFASWLGGSQAADMEQVSVTDGASPIGNDIDGYYFDLSEIITEIERRVNEKTWLNLKKPFKLYPESAVEFWKRRAEIAANAEGINEKMMNKYLNEKLNLEDKVKMQAEYIKKVCAESSADIQRLDTENKKLKERNEALKRQLDESNRQIEIYAKKVRNLEAELEEDGGLGKGYGGYQPPQN